MKTVYWSPFFPSEQYPSIQLMYETPDSLLPNLLPRRNKEANGDNWFQCHAFLGAVKNTFVLRIPFDIAFGLRPFYIARGHEKNFLFLSKGLQVERVLSFHHLFHHSANH